MKVSDEILKKVVSRECNTAVYSFLTKDGGLQHVNNTACHASAMRGLVLPGSVAIINKRCFPESADEDTELYYNWLINDSPCADAFITKDPKIANNSHTIVDLSKPRDMVGNALVATRGPWEKESHFKLWASLVRLGIEGHVAYGFITLHYVGDRGEVVVKNPDSLHWMICGEKQNVTNLVYKSKWPEYDKDSYIDMPGWESASSVFRGEFVLPQMCNSDFLAYYNKARERVEGVDDSVSLNIFQEVIVERYKKNITYQACADFIKDKWL